MINVHMINCKVWNRNQNFGEKQINRYETGNPLASNRSDTYQTHYINSNCIILFLSFFFHNIGWDLTVIKVFIIHAFD